jgi:hypothetical protein
LVTKSPKGDFSFLDLLYGGGIILVLLRFRLTKKFMGMEESLRRKDKKPKQEKGKYTEEDMCPAGCDGFLSLRAGANDKSYLYCPHCTTDFGPPKK